MPAFTPFACTLHSLSSLFVTVKFRLPLSNCTLTVRRDGRTHVGGIYIRAVRPSRRNNFFCLTVVIVTVTVNRHYY
jgi:hypothetical protein